MLTLLTNINVLYNTQVNLATWWSDCGNAVIEIVKLA